MSGPAGPTGTIVLKKIADNTYEQYGAITLSATALTQVTVSQTILQNLVRFDPESQMIWREDFFSRVSQSQNSQNSKGWPSGSWGTQGTGNEVMKRMATETYGAVSLQSSPTSTGGGIWAQFDKDSGGGTGKTLSNINRLPTYYMRWAQSTNSAAGNRAIGWQWVDGSVMNNTAFGIYFRHAHDQHIEGVCRNNNVESTVSSGVNASHGVYHAGRIVITNTLVSTMLIGEYIGNGVSPRRLDVVSYTPACVWIMGKDAGGKEVGGFQINGMPSGVSHPWINNPATGAASRANRLIDLTSTGFSVGSSLNVSGDAYCYIVFPPVSGFSATGSYTGTGWSREGAVQIDTTGGGFHVTAGSQFLAADVGQVMVRVSDGATIGTIATVTNGSNATGTVNISDVFPAGTWRWQPRQIPIGFVPDLAMLCAQTVLAVSDATPAQFAPGRGLSDDLSSSGTTQGFTGTSLSPGNATVQTNSQTLEVRNDDPSATAGFNGTGVTYHWFAFKTGSSQILFDKIDYTGDGAASRILSGATGTPGFWMGFGKSDIPKFKANFSRVTTGTNDYPFIDGNALVADNITFGAGTVSLGVGDLNISNTLYRAYTATNSGQTAGPAAQFFLDGTSIGTVFNNLPTVDLKPGFSQSNTSAVGMYTDYMAVIQNRTA